MSTEFRVPILFQFYNNWQTTFLVFQEIRKVKPKYLYLVQDKFRPNSPWEEEECLKVRKDVIGMIDWDCNLFTLFRETNLGPGKGTANAIKWFFNKVEYGIVLEHDCLPSPDFFNYCSILLERFKNNHEVKLICGSNYQMKKKFSNASYYFGKSGQLWGWASWNRVFKDYSEDISGIDQALLLLKIKSIFKIKKVEEYWINTINLIKTGDVITWDYQLLYKIWLEDGLIVFPNSNLISNIGFGECAIHCKYKKSKLANALINGILPLKHPKKIKRSANSDINYYNNYISYQNNNIIKRHYLYLGRLKRNLIHKYLFD